MMYGPVATGSAWLDVEMLHPDWFDGRRPARAKDNMPFGSATAVAVRSGSLLLRMYV
jgi:hypothetical protein